jgi:hypothetical protein
VTVTTPLGGFESGEPRLAQKFISTPINVKENLKNCQSSIEMSPSLNSLKMSFFGVLAIHHRYNSTFTSVPGFIQENL